MVLVSEEGDGRVSNYSLGLPAFLITFMVTVPGATGDAATAIGTGSRGENKVSPLPDLKISLQQASKAESVASHPGGASALRQPLGAGEREEAFLRRPSLGGEREGCPWQRVGFSNGEESRTKWGACLGKEDASAGKCTPRVLWDAPTPSLP